MKNYGFSRALTFGLAVACVSIVPPSVISASAYGQAISTNGGSIQGTITDPTGASIPNASIVISNPDTGFSHALTADKSGFYALGPLIPGNYTITVSAANFENLKATTVVRTGTVTSGNEKLTLGKSLETVEVSTGSVQVNTDQIGVAGVITKEQIDTLPINGRNILDIAQLEPGVILQSGESFDPTKTGYSAISVGGVSGRTTRILVDGQDITDETVGTVLFNVPTGAVSEFQLNRSTQDVSGEVSSTGQVLISTQSGVNRIHGSAFYNFQDYRVGFANVLGLRAPFQRNQFGGYIGGPIIKDKLFFFGGSERIKQDASNPAGSSLHFQSIFNQYPNVPNPFRDTFSLARLDYNAPKGIHLFARGAYSVNAGDGNSGLAPYSVFKNQDNVPALVGGADFTTGRFTHSIRFGYEKFINAIADGTASLGNSIYNPSKLVGFQIELVGGIDAGQNELAPQKTFQSDKQLRYDGTYTIGGNNIKFGGELTRILQGGFAPFFGGSLYTDVSTSTRFVLAHCNNDGVSAPCPGDPLNGYKPAEYLIGNGNGVFSERPGFGLPGGGDFSWRIAGYVADTYKVKPYLTLEAGLRWSTDTDRANQDVPTPLCSQVDPSLQFAGCTGNTPLFDQFGPGYGLGVKTHQPYGNFGPQAGFVFSPGSQHLVVRGGAGIYYESNLFNNTSNARTPVITAQGQYFNYGAAVYNSPNIFLPGLGAVTGLTANGTPCTPNGGTCQTIAQVFSQSVAQASTIINGLKTQYDAASKVPAPNSSFIGTGGGLVANNIYGGPYKSPYSIQFNGGVQYELRKGIVLSADYIHNATLKVPTTIDTNHIGAARYLNTAAAQNAIAATVAAYPTCVQGFSAASINCAIANGATIDNFAGNGLDSGNDYLGGAPASVDGLTPNTGAAFAGANPNVGNGRFILPIGKSGYDALQIVLQEQRAHPFPGIMSSNLQISYNLSRIVTTATSSDQFFAGAGAYNQDNVTEFMGRNGLDHTNQVSFGGSFGIKYGLQVAVIGHFYSAPPSTLTLPTTTGAGQIFKTDVDGDGTEGDLVPLTLPGAYGHQIKGAGLNQLISTYNSTQVGTLTPAGKALVAANLFTPAQLAAIGAVQQALAPAPTNPLSTPPVRTFDFSANYPIHLSRLREGVVLTPGINIYNVANQSNFGTFGGLVSGADGGTAAANGSLNGPNSSLVQETARVGRGSGTFDQGGPRSMEFQLKLIF